MKTLFILLLPFTLIGQTFTDKIVKELQFEKQSASNTLVLANVNGSIKVQGYEGTKIIIEAERTIKAKTEARLEQGKKDVKISQIEEVDTLVVYTANGCNTFGRKGNKNRRQHSGTRWSYEWNCDNGDCNPPYDHVMNYTVKVPYGINVEVSTVNEGNVTIENVSGAVKANNVNGSIRLTALKGATYANTINGDVDLEYASNPNKDCRYYTLNGDINAWFQKGLAANLAFKSFNGDFYTNIAKLEDMPSMVEKKQTENGISLKVSSNRFKVGNGGALLDFETFNGDVILKEKSN
jgi:hypothetical protein